MKKIHLIAENDAAGDVLWLWRWDGTNSRARPLRAGTLKPDTLAEAVVHGASTKAVSKWLDSQQG